jgi:DNA modification methylase
MGSTITCRNKILQGNVLDVLSTFPDACIHMCVTSPPYYGLRSYGTEHQIWQDDCTCEHDWVEVHPPGYRSSDTNPGELQHEGNMNRDKFVSYRCKECGAWKGELGSEETPDEYVAHLVEIFREVRRVLRDDGTFWLNIGDSYNGSGGAGGDYANGGLKEGQPKYPGRKIDGLKPKDLMEIPSMVASALRSDGWYLRSRIPWFKRNSLPESVKDRPASALEYVFLLTKSPKYYYDHLAVREGSKGTSLARQRRAVSDKHKNIFGAPGQTPHSCAQPRENDPNREVSEGRNRRNTDWFFESWQGLYEEDNEPLAFIVNPAGVKDAHFAVMPEKLVEPCILAGTSEHGCCAECGAPIGRIIEEVAAVSTECPKTQAAHEARGGTGEPVGTVGKSGSGRINGYTKTLGWKPTCACECCTDTHRAIVLDPFMGSGTVAVVALKNNRDFVGIDLNPEYIRISEKRIAPHRHKKLSDYMGSTENDLEI